MAQLRSSTECTKIRGGQMKYTFSLLVRFYILCCCCCCCFNGNSIYRVHPILMLGDIPKDIWKVDEGGLLFSKVILILLHQHLFLLIVFFNQFTRNRCRGWCFLDLFFKSSLTLVIFCWIAYFSGKLIFLIYQQTHIFYSQALRYLPSILIRQLVPDFHLFDSRLQVPSLLRHEFLSSFVYSEDWWKEFISHLCNLIILLTLKRRVVLN